MSVEPFLFDFSQSATLDLSQTEPTILDVHPGAWAALEMLTSPNTKQRMAGLDKLVEMDLARSSPTAAYVLATRIVEPDLDLRKRICQQLSRLVNVKAGSGYVNQAVQDSIHYHLSHLDTRQIYSLLQITESDVLAREDVAEILNTCSRAGESLSEILLERRYPMEIRKQAAYLIGRIGYMEAAPALQRLAARLESRLAALPFGVLDAKDETALLDDIKAALAMLD
jgi:hypothetical protein